MVSDRAVGHRDAADRHELAAEQHERAARFWDEQQDPDRAGLQRVMAAYERLGAELERRWAELIDTDAAHREVRAAELVIRHTRQGAKQASAILMQLAKTLETSAGLAEEHAQRRERGPDGPTMPQPSVKPPSVLMRLPSVPARRLTNG